MAPRKPPVWRIESPAFRCPHCKKPVRAVYYGRWQFWGLKGGRGWRQQDPDRDPVAPPEPRVTPREPLYYSPGPADEITDDLLAKIRRYRELNRSPTESADSNPSL